MHRGDDVGLLAAHGAALAGVGVEAGHGDARGRGGRSRVTRPRWVTRSVASRSAGVRAAGTSASGMWIVTGTTRSVGRGQHHHRAGRAGEVGEVLGMAGEGEAGAVLQRLLVDGVGAEGERGAAADELDAAGDDGDDGGGVLRARAAGLGRAGQRVRQDGEAGGHGGGRLVRARRWATTGPPRCAGSPIRKKASSSRSAAQALSAISPPIPAGSPSVSATGFIARR